MYHHRTAEEEKVYSAAATTVFNAADTNNDGMLDKDEFEAIAHKLPL